MLQLARLEFRKLRRCNILLVGVVTLLFPPLISILQQISMNEPVTNYGFQNLIHATIWYNMSLFLPITLVLLGGYMMNREYTDDTLKNLFTIPLSYKELIAGKLLALIILTILYSMYSALLALLFSVFFFPNGLSVISVIFGIVQVVGMGLCLYVAILPLIIWCCGKKNRLMVGIVLVFVYGFFSIPIAGHGLQDFYPVTAGLTLIHYGGDTGSVITSDHLGIAVLMLLSMLLLAGIVVHVQSNRINRL